MSVISEPFSTTLPYELNLVVKSGVISGGGLAHESYVEVSIDGQMFATTEIMSPPPVWNKEITKKFKTIEPATPIILSFSLYKKRWTSHGFKLVGTVQFPLSDLFSIINKGPIDKHYDLLSNRRNLTVGGTLLLSLELKAIKATPKSTDNNKSIITATAIEEKHTKFIKTTLKKPFLQQIISLDSIHLGINCITLMAVLILLFIYFNNNKIAKAYEKLDHMEKMLKSMEGKIIAGMSL